MLMADWSVENMNPYMTPNGKLLDISLSPIFFLKRYKKSLKITKGQSESHMEEEQTTQWPKEKVQKDKQRYTKQTSYLNSIPTIYRQLP